MHTITYNNYLYISFCGLIGDYFKVTGSALNKVHVTLCCPSTAQYLNRIYKDYGQGAQRVTPDLFSWCSIGWNAVVKVSNWNQNACTRYITYHSMLIGPYITPLCRICLRILGKSWGIILGQLWEIFKGMFGCF